MYQSGALFGSMTLLENVRLPLETATNLPDEAIDLIARMKLELVGLEGFTGHLPAELSGGMQKRAGIARAMGSTPRSCSSTSPHRGWTRSPSAIAGRDGAPARRGHAASRSSWSRTTLPVRLRVDRPRRASSTRRRAASSPRATTRGSSATRLPTRASARSSAASPRRRPHDDERRRRWAWQPPVPGTRQAPGRASAWHPTVA